jgi:splicing factor 3A subunit 1
MVVTGIIRPPLDIRAVADKTALFVSKNGRAFENRILNSEKGQTPKFAFLHDNSPFHAYYEDKIRFYQQGGTDEKKDKKEEEQQEEKKEEQLKLAVIRKPAQQAEKKSAHDPIAKALLRQRNNIRSQYEQAEKDRKESKGDDNNKDQQPTRVVITPPPPLHYVGITAPTNLTAAQVETIKLVAQFITLDESKNFLQNLTIREWNNPTFAFLQPRHAHFAYFSALADCYKYIVQAALKKGFKAKSSLQEYLDLAAYRAEYQLDAAERKQGDAEDDEANAIDWHDFVLVETIEFAKDERVQPLVMPLEVDEMQESDDDEDGETIRVVPNYTPKVVASGQTSISQTHVIDPITGKSVPAAQTSEHMRIQLLDPKWAEEKKKFQEKQKESNLVAGDAIATNLSRVVGDVSGRVSNQKVCRLIAMTFFD